jgi:hypothetical protein
MEINPRRPCIFLLFKISSQQNEDVLELEFGTLVKGEFLKENLGQWKSSSAKITETVWIEFINHSTGSLLYSLVDGSGARGENFTLEPASRVKMQTVLGAFWLVEDTTKNADKVIGF